MNATHKSEPTKTGVGVLDKSVAMMDLVERHPMTLPEITDSLDVNISTAYRLATALCRHGFMRRDDDGRYFLGHRFSQAVLTETAGPALRQLRDTTGESTQLWVKRGAYRLCVLSFESNDALRVVLEVGSLIPLQEGSAALILTGRYDTELGYAATEGTRVPGIGSVSAPVLAGDQLVAAVCLTGPLPRITPDPGSKFGNLVAECGARIGSTLPAT
ncbi:helix-turn-helix domain-containing protein [Rhodococcoides fascians A25f]|uniref:IclR family transcriptional regulator n=1 Tax=Rhodococcoides fascians TaxID=1828 RepID=UPI000561F6D0|nr:helix-turn-helix domain-containing protein [Rhodococcus fascians]QII07292.1 helix-turn-helix domain-containing protein [Rhodococcus fascians A25f]